MDRVFGLDTSIQHPLTSIAAGAGSGAIGGELYVVALGLMLTGCMHAASLGNPLFLIKARMQACFFMTVCALDRC